MYIRFILSFVHVIYEYLIYLKKEIQNLASSIDRCHASSFYTHPRILHYILNCRCRCTGPYTDHRTSRAYMRSEIHTDIPSIRRAHPYPRISVCRTSLLVFAHFDGHQLLGENRTTVKVRFRDQRFRAVTTVPPRHQSHVYAIPHILHCLPVHRVIR